MVRRSPEEEFFQHTIGRETCQRGGSRPWYQVTKKKKFSREKTENGTLGLIADHEENSFNRRQKPDLRGSQNGTGNPTQRLLFHTIALRRGRVGDTVVRGHARSGRPSFPLGRGRLAFLIRRKTN